MEKHLSFLHEQNQENREKFYSTIDKLSIPINKIAEGMNELTPTNTILQFLAVINVMWLITSFSWLSKGRSFIFIISSLELFAEILLHWFAMQGHIMVTFKEILIPKIRMGILGLDVLVLFISMCFYFFRSKPADVRYDFNPNYPMYPMNTDSRYIPAPTQNIENTTYSPTKSPRCYNDNINMTPIRQTKSRALPNDECFENLFNTISNLQKRTEQKLPFQSPDFKRSNRNSQVIVESIDESIAESEIESIAREENEDTYLLNEIIAAKSNLVHLLQYVDTIEKERIRSPKRKSEDTDSEEDIEEERGGKKIRLSP